MTFPHLLGYNVTRLKAEKVSAQHIRRMSADRGRRSRDRLSFRERGSPAVSPFKLQFVLNFRTGAALRGAQAEEDRIRDSDMICSAVTRSAVARVKRIKSLIMIRNQGGTADIIRPFRFVESGGTSFCYKGNSVGISVIKPRVKSRCGKCRGGQVGYPSLEYLL